MLVLGGFRLRQSDLDVLEAAAASVVNSERGRRQHIMGIAVMAFGTLLQEPRGSDERPSLHGIVQVRTALNDDYQGAITLNENPRPDGLLGSKEICRKSTYRCSPRLSRSLNSGGTNPAG